jgi:hypothetical protein
MKQRQTRRARTRERRRREFVTKKNEMEHAHIRVGTPAETEHWECWEEVREVLGSLRCNRGATEILVSVHHHQIHIES